LYDNPLAKLFPQRDTIYHGDCWEMLPELPPVSLVIARGLNAWPCRELPADANTQVNGENHTTEQKNNDVNNN